MHKKVIIATSKVIILMIIISNENKGYIILHLKMKMSSLRLIE